MHGVTLRRRFVWKDLETTGTIPEQARIKQIAMRVYEIGKEPMSYKTLVNPGVPIPDEAASVTGITDEIIANGCARCRKPQDQHPSIECTSWRQVPMFRDLAQNLYNGFKDADFGGYNVNYDLKVSKAEFARHNITFDYSDAFVIDPFRIWNLKERRRLEDAVRRFLKREMDGAHDADVDISETIEVFVAQLAEWDDLPREVGALHELLWPKDPNWIDREGKFIWLNGEACFNFGKQKGQRLRDNKGYLSWMLRGDFSVEVKAIAKQALDGILPPR
jgi:DNA polymerase-3 subunit epsilon